jgi:hypothetical protein
MAVLAVLRDAPSVSAAPDRAADFSAVKSHANIAQHALGTSERAAGPSNVKSDDKTYQHGSGAIRRVAGAVDGQRRAKSH